MGAARCIYGNCFVVCFSTTKTTKIPPPPEKYSLNGMILHWGLYISVFFISTVLYQYMCWYDPSLRVTFQCFSSVQFYISTCVGMILHWGLHFSVFHQYSFISVHVLVWSFTEGYTFQCFSSVQFYISTCVGMILHWGLYISVFFISTVLYQYMCWHDPSLRVIHFSVFHQYSFISVHVLSWSFTEGYTFQCFSSVQFYISTCVGMILHWGLYISVFFISTVLYQYMCWHDPSLRVIHFSVFHQYSFISVHVLAWSFTEGYTFQCFSSVQFYISTCVGMILHWGLYISVFFISTVLYQYMCWHDPSLRVIHFSVFHQYSFISVHVLAWSFTEGYTFQCFSSVQFYISTCVGMILHWGLYISVFFISTVLYQYMCWYDPSLRVIHFSVFHQYSFISVHVLAWSFTEGNTFQCFSSVQFYISTCVGMILHWGLYISVFFISTVLYQYMCWYDPSLRVIHFSVFHQYSFISVHVLVWSFTEGYTFQCFSSVQFYISTCVGMILHWGLYISVFFISTVLYQYMCWHVSHTQYIWVLSIGFCCGWL